MNETPLRSPLSPPVPSSPGHRIRWSQLPGCSLSLALSQAALTHHGPTLVISPNPAAARDLESELRFFLRDEAVPVRSFPDWETLPYDIFSPHQDIISERLATLHQLPNMSRGILVVPISTLLSRIAPRAYLEPNSFLLAPGERLDIDQMRQRFERAGYRAVGQVMEHGEFAVRGSLLDVYPMGGRTPFRIDLFDDEVDSIREFDPETQRSEQTVEQIRVLPAREFPLDEEGIAHFRQRWRAAFEGDPRGCRIYRDVSEGHASAGIEYYLPLFFEHTETLFQFLPDNTLVLEMDRIAEAAADFWSDLIERHEQRRHDIERPVLAPDALFLSPQAFHTATAQYSRITVGTFDNVPQDREVAERRGFFEYATHPPPALPIDVRANDPLTHVKQWLEGFDGRVLFAAETAGRQEVLVETFSRHGIRLTRVENWESFRDGTVALGVAIGALENGVVLDLPSLSIVTESQLFGERVAQRRRRKPTSRDAESVLRDLTELTLGAPVVHEHHGVGRYLGLQTLTAGGATSEFLTLEYEGGDKLYVPVLSLHLISRYSGVDPEHAPLHRLGSAQWQKAKRKAAERVRDVAAELLDIQARRAARTGHRFTVDTDEYHAFVQSFPFEETPDQQAAIDAVQSDMASDGPMDRLICGDVGFGKTEVAMRAAFAATLDGWQVAVLVPTTLLAQQHDQNFSDRFADWPVRVEQLSRFRSKKERDAVVDSLRSGHVDIVIGTHRLLQDDIRFKRLGLVIIDEEHRFGVRQKERFKALRSEVDVLTLTATPIPRTLNMAMANLRELSLIATPPERRLSIKTFVNQRSDPQLREAFLREIRRGGQVYFVHNRVEDIERITDEVRELIPEADVRIAHGQMREAELERVMGDFYHRRFNVLICTTIIETGIDVPSANTIVINRADRFGLAQLHQLRGRVGRSHHRAYAYLLVPERRSMTSDAVKRLDAIEALEDLGIGFSLATHDLEIRGAGELLGEDQSGQMHEVGYSLYIELLERAVNALKSGRSPDLDRPLDHGTEIDLHVPALIPDDYVPDVHTRLILYKRIASAAGEEPLHELKVELIDRFGLLPDAAKTLFEITALKLKASPLGIKKIDLGGTGGRLVFGHEPNIDPVQIIQLIQTQPKHYRLDGQDKLRITHPLPTLEARVKTLSGLLDTLAAKEEAA